MVSKTVKATAGISAVTLISRILGLLRDMAMIRVLGFSWATGTFALAWMIPNMLRRLFGEGALAASFIPAYTKAARGGEPEAARRLLGSVTALMTLFLGTATAIVLLVSWLLPGAWIGQASEVPGLEVDAATQGDLLLELTIILFPYAIPICLTAVFAGALNAHGTFTLPATAPIVLNLFWLAALGLCFWQGIGDPRQIVTVVAAFLLVGGFAQMSMSLIPLLRARLFGPLALPEPGAPARAVVRNMGPTILGMSMVQINTMLDQGFALYLIDPSAPSFIYVANRLLLFPHALTSLALATAIFPRFSDLAGKNDLPGLRQLVDRASRHTLLIATPAAAGMILIAEPLIDVMFRSPESTPESLRTASITTACLVASLPAIGVAQLHARALYAVGDYRTPAWLSFWLLLCNLVLNLLLVVVLGLGVPGLVGATALTSLVQVGVLRRKVLELSDQGRPLRLASTLATTAGMAGVVALTQWAVDGGTRLERVGLDLALPIGAGILSYGALQYALGQRDLRLRP